MAAPPGVTERDFSRALEELANAIGGEWVFTSEEDLNLYRDAYSPFKGEAEDRVPSAAVAPDTVEQVQAIVRIANRYRLPLWTIATGRNLGLRRIGARLLRQRRRRLETHESDPRGQRQDSLRRRRAGRQLLRSLSVRPGAQAQRLDRSRRSRLGQPRRQCARARRRAHADARPLERRVRARGRARERRGLAHGHGRAARIGGLASVQVRLRADRRRPVLAIELRHRDAHGHLVDAGSRGLPRRARDGRAARRPRAVHGDLRVSHELRHPARHDAAGEPVAELPRVAGRLVLRNARRSFDRRARSHGPRSEPTVLERGAALLGAAQAHRRTVGSREGKIRRDSRRDRSRTAAATCFRPKWIRTTRRSPSRSASRALAFSAYCKAAGIWGSRRSSR